MLGIAAHDRTISIAWQVVGGDQSFDEYHLDATRIEECSERVRAKLKAMPEALQGSREKLPEALHDLATVGIALYDAVLSNAPTRPETRESADVFRRWFEATVIKAEPGTWRIEILLANPQKVYPLGFAFTPRPGWSPGPSDATFESYIDFWCCGLQLATYSALPVEFHVTDPEGDFKRVSLLVEKDDGSFRNYIEEFSADEDRTRHVFADENSAETIVDKHLRVFGEGWHHIIYVLLKHDGSDARTHREIPRNINEEALRYVLLDGDAVIRGDRGAAWSQLIMSNAWNGVIAVETDLPDYRNGFPGWRFLRATMKRRLSEHLLDVRRDTWPEGLLYGIYGPPAHWYISPPPDDDLDHLENVLTEVHRRSTSTNLRRS